MSSTLGPHKCINLVLQDAAKLSPHVPPPTALQKEALAFVQEVAKEQHLRFDYQLEPGEQFQMLSVAILVNPFVKFPCAELP